MLTSLTDLFEDITEGLEHDRDSLNALDKSGDGDAGDNLVQNFTTITKALRQVEKQDVTVDQALVHASKALQQDGKGATAQMYANGLVQAAQNMEGKKSFSMGDLTGLLGGLLGGVQQTPGVKPQGSGGLLDSLLPGIQAFMESRNAGKSTIESLLSGYMASQRGAYGTTASQSPGGQFEGRDTTGQVDPGAAGATSLLGSLFRSLLTGGLSAGRGEQPRKTGLGDLFGGLAGQQGDPQQGGQQQGGVLGGLGDLFGGAGGLGSLGELFGSLGGGNPPQGQQRGGAEPRAQIGPKESI